MILISHLPVLVSNVQVERDDVTTKLCAECFGKINKYFAFREFCSTKNIGCLLDSIANNMEMITNDNGGNDCVEESSFSAHEIASDASCETDLDMENTASNEDEAVSIMCITVTDTDSDDEGMNARHSRRTKFKCPVRKCGRIFQDRPDLRKHMKSMHKQNVVRPIASEQLANANKRHTYRHLQHAHSEKVVPSAMRLAPANEHLLKIHCIRDEANGRFWCTMWRCNELFESREALAYHQEGMYHRRDIKLTFECYLCGNISSKYMSIRKHMYRMHFRQKWLTCPIPGPLSNDRQKDVVKFKPFFGWDIPDSMPCAEREKEYRVVPPLPNGRQKNRSKFKPFYGYASPTS